MDSTEIEKKSDNQISSEVDIFKAVKSGKLAEVQRVLEHEGPQVFLRHDVQGHTPTHWACLEGSISILNLILENGGLYNCLSQGQLAQKPIHWAAHNGHIPVVQALLQLGVSVDEKDTSGKTPLMIAAQNGKSSLVAFLVSLKANIHQVDKDGDSALHWAAYNGHTETMRLLVHVGCQTELKDNFLMTPLHIASLRGHAPAVRDLCLLDNADTTARDNKNETPKMLALRKQKPNVVSELEKAEAKNRTSLWPSSFNTLVEGSFLGSNNRLLLFICFFVLFCGYPFYIYNIFFRHFNQLLISNLLFIFFNILFWVSLYKTSQSDPGFVAINQADYQATMTNLANFHDVMEATEKLGRLCHTCRCVKPLRSKHCRSCNRCVSQFDHHCFYVANCIGLANRAWFLLFTFSSFLVILIAISFMHFLRTNDEDTLVGWVGFFFLCAFFLLTGLVLFATLINISNGLTTNEMANWRRYTYLHDNTGLFHNPFHKGPLQNLMDFLGIEPGPQGANDVKKRSAVHMV